MSTVELTFNLNAPPELSEKAVHAIAMLKLLELACQEAAKLGISKATMVAKVGGVVHDLWVE